MSSAAELTQQAAAFHQRGELEQAGRLYLAALAVDPDFFEARNRLGSVRLAQRRVDEAIAEFERALIVNPQSAEALCNLGNALATGGRLDEALACYDGALMMQGNYREALNNRGNVLSALGRLKDAISSYDAAIVVEPGEPAPYFNRGLARFALLQHSESVADFDAAIARKPDHAEAFHARGNALRALRRHEEAAASYSEAARHYPDLTYAIGDALHAQMQLCDWQNFDASLARIIDGVGRGVPVTVPFILFSLCDDPDLQLKCAATCSRQFSSPESFRSFARPTGHGRPLRLAYLSAKFHEHAGARLIAELLEIHHRERFSPIGISFGPDDQGDMRARLRSTFDEFIDVRSLSDSDVAALLRHRGIDIAIDLVGYAENARPGIFAHRAAPIQVSFLGFPGTMGADFIDYLIADHVVIPLGQECYYSEKVIRLPHSYQVNDSKRRIAERIPTRAEAGLRDHGFVFCCFNNNFKITPAMFSVWMRLLKRVDNSILWLLRGSTAAERNLRREAESSGVDPNRLVFAPQLPLADHLARHRLADLFLDTLPYNAHVTASDALWAGLPVLTCIGRAFAARVAASLLNAIDLAELVTTNLSEYEARAVELATNPSLMAVLKEKLVRSLPAAPLFDTERFRGHIESAYTTMWEMHARGEPPRSFAVRALER